MRGYRNVLAISAGFALLAMWILGSKDGQKRTTKRKRALPLQVWEGEGGNVLDTSFTATQPSKAAIKEKATP